MMHQPEKLRFGPSDKRRLLAGEKTSQRAGANMNIKEGDYPKVLTRGNSGRQSASRRE
jgi:hypothetical protein